MSNGADEFKACPYCTEQIGVNAKKCKHCGEILDVALRAVEDMKRTQQGTGPIIVNNNNNNNNNSSAISPPLVLQKSRTTYIVLAIFLGLLGVHNFYAGYTLRGILQLVLSCTLVGMTVTVLWVILEIICVKRDGNGVLFA